MHILRLMSGLILCTAVLAFTGHAGDTKYIGAKTCSMCHKAGKGGTAFAVWEKTAHAKAYQTLLGDAAKKFATEKGLKVPPNEAPECLKCHVTGGGAAKNVEATFKKEEGVTCEACHGAASAYKIIHSKGDLAKNKEAGMIIPDKTGKTCETCHNAGSPTFKGFKYAEMWAKIEHGLPPKK
jgi:hypothetical protein